MTAATIPLAVFLHAGEYDRMHQGLSIAAAAVAMNRRVDVFVFWWALERLAAGKLDGPGQELPASVTDAFESGRAPTLRTLLSHLRESGLCRVFACSGSTGILGLEASGIRNLVDAFVGWSRILELTAEATERFYL